jgi:hypothetical protein
MAWYSKRAKVYVFVSITNDMLRNKTEGLTPSKAIRRFILACNEQGAISDYDARYKERYNIQQMR